MGFKPLPPLPAPPTPIPPLPSSCRNPLSFSKPIYFRLISSRSFTLPVKFRPNSVIAFIYGGSRGAGGEGGEMVLPLFLLEK